MNKAARSAYEDYKQGLKYKEIADKYGVSLSAVKSWAARYWKGESCNQESARLQPPKEKVATKKGGQLGNQNAKGNRGGAAPKKNKNAVTTGEFETLLFDCLKPEERELANSVPLDKGQLLLQEIRLLTVREYRMLKRIEDLQRMDFTVVKKKSGDEFSIEEYAVLGQIQSIEDALTRVQSRKQRAIETLHRFGFDDARLELELARVELASLKNAGPETEMEDDGFLEAINGQAAELWSDADVGD